MNSDEHVLFRKTCKRWDESWTAHYLTFSCYRRQPFLKSHRSATWFLDALNRARLKTPFDLWAFVIMPEHVHLVLLPHEGVVIGQILYHLKKPVTTVAVNWVKRNSPSFLAEMRDCQPCGRTCLRFWQRGGGYDRNLRSNRDIHEKIRYIHSNPVRRGLVTVARDWPWSSCRAWEDGVDEPILLDRSTIPVWVSS